MQFKFRMGVFHLRNYFTFLSTKMEDTGLPGAPRQHSGESVGAELGLGTQARKDFSRGQGAVEDTAFYM